MATAHPDISDFLKSRRARVKPEDVGVVTTRNRRRVAGLRREELAQLAAVSVDYYTRLEQGRAERVSDSVLDSIADALLLDDVEREHLHRLANPPRRRPSPTPGVHTGLRLLLRDLPERPAFVLGRRMDVLAWNPLARKLIADFDTLAPARRNLARLVLLDEQVRRLYPDRELAVSNAAGFLRRDLGLHPDDAELGALVAELNAGSAEFRRKWSQHTVSRKSSGVKKFDHPRAGEFELSYQSLELPGSPDQILVVYSPRTRSESDKLRELAVGVGSIPE